MNLTQAAPLPRYLRETLPYSSGSLAILAAIRRALSSEIRDCGTERPAQRNGLRVTAPALCSRCQADGWIETPRCQFDNLADAV
jgi:hypothetical protein